MSQWNNIGSWNDIFMFLLKPQNIFSKVNAENILIHQRMEEQNCGNSRAVGFLEET